MKTLTDQEVWARCFEIAKKNGWKPPLYLDGEMMPCVHRVTKRVTGFLISESLSTTSIYSMLYDREIGFAKALLGDEPVDDRAGGVIPRWKDHLRIMIDVDVTEYLRGWLQYDPRARDISY
jgi:hypothetical protein